MTARTPAADGRVAIVVVNYGSHELLAANLAWATPGGPNPPGPVVIVDNPRSAEDTAAIAALAARQGWDLVRCPSNDGFGSGVNRGAERAWELGCVGMIVVNPDVALASSDADALREEVVRVPETLTAPLVLGPDGRPWGRLGRVDVRAGRLRGAGDAAGPTWVSGACFGIHRDLWDRLGGFDEDYVMYWEDVDLSVRCQEAGGAVVVREDVVVTHDVGGTQEASGGKSSLYYYYNCRNRLVFAAKHLTGRELLRWIVLTPADARRVANRGTPQGRLRKLRAAVPPVLRGSAAGLVWAVRFRARRRGAAAVAR